MASAMAPAIATGPPMLGRARAAMTGCNRIASFCPTIADTVREMVPGDRRHGHHDVPGGLRHQPGDAQPHLGAVQGRRTRRPRPGGERNAGRARLMHRGASRLQNPLPPLLTPELDRGAHVLVPLEAVAALAPAEHGCPPASDSISMGCARPVLRRRGRGNATLRPNRGADGTAKAAADQYSIRFGSSPPLRLSSLLPQLNAAAICLG